MSVSNNGKDNYWMTFEIERQVVLFCSFNNLLSECLGVFKWDWLDFEELGDGKESRESELEWGWKERVVDGLDDNEHQSLIIWVKSNHFEENDSQEVEAEWDFG